MTERQLGRVLIVGVGLWALVQALAMLGAIGSALASGVAAGRPRTVAPFLLIAAIPGTLALALLLGRHWLAERLFRTDPTDLTARTSDLLPALLAVLGVWFMAEALVHLVPDEVHRWFVIHEATSVAPGAPFDLSAAPDLLRGRIRWVAKTLVGLGLYLGSDKLAAVWLRTRPVGTPLGESQRPPGEAS